MAVGEQDERRIPAAIPSNSAGRLDEPIDLLRSQMLTRASFAVREALGWSNFPVFGSWPRRSDRRHRYRSRGRYRLTFPF